MLNAYFLCLQKIWKSNAHTLQYLNPTIPRCLGATVWTSDILSLITCSQHKEAQQTRRPILLVSVSLLLASAPSLPFSFMLFGLEDEGCGKQGQKEKERLAAANNPLFQHVHLHISKLKLSAKKKRLLNIKHPLASSDQAHHIPPSSAQEACSAGFAELQ